MYFNPFNVGIRKARKGWKRKTEDDKYIPYKVLAIDIDKSVNSNMFTNDIKPKEETNSEEIIVCWVMLGNSENGKIEWFNISELRFLE